MRKVHRKVVGAQEIPSHKRRCVWHRATSAHCRWPRRRPPSRSSRPSASRRRRSSMSSGGGRRRCRPSGTTCRRLQVLDLPGGVPGGVVPRQVGVHGAPHGGHAAALRHQPRLHRALEARLRRRAAPHPQGEPAGEPARARARLGRADHPVAGRLPPRRRAHAVVLDDRAVFRKGRRRDVRRPLWHRRGAIYARLPLNSCDSY